ncbi:hypothetical protein LCGC14_2375340 [marine sediment metagenome]|uniref:Uncharacterized protein n=1 Tax=marine sediment metagenome TaxID=412755 RepID=A0A0F9CPT1_9ZZZZ
MANCRHCGKECGTDEEWTEEQRDAEMKRNFGELAKEDRISVCTECYHYFMLKVKEKYYAL